MERSWRTRTVQGTIEVQQQKDQQNATPGATTHNTTPYQQLLINLTPLSLPYRLLSRSWIAQVFRPTDNLFLNIPSSLTLSVRNKKGVSCLDSIDGKYKPLVEVCYYRPVVR